MREIRPMQSEQINTMADHFVDVNKMVAIWGYAV